MLKLKLCVMSSLVALATSATIAQSNQAKVVGTFSMCAAATSAQHKVSNESEYLAAAMKFEIYNIGFVGRGESTAELLASDRNFVSKLSAGVLQDTAYKCLEIYRRLVASGK